MDGQPIFSKKEYPKGAVPVRNEGGRIESCRKHKGRGVCDHRTVIGVLCAIEGRARPHHGRRAREQSPVVAEPDYESTPCRILGGHEPAEGTAQTSLVGGGRTSLYPSDASIILETSRRLGTIPPESPVRRGVRNDKRLAPVTAKLIELMLPEGSHFRSCVRQSTLLKPAQEATPFDLLREATGGVRTGHAPRWEPVGRLFETKARDS